jgi:branched-chain amino acid transport system substrate-binding protein
VTRGDAGAVAPGRHVNGGVMVKNIDRRQFMKSVGVAGVAMSAAGIPGLARSQSAPGEVEVGVLCPMSGPSGPFGQNGARGWNIAVDEINETGGIKALGGAKIKTLLRDTESTPKTGIAETEKLARSKAVAIVGAWNSAVTFPCTQLAEQYKIPWVVDMSTQDEIMRRGFKYSFRSCAEGTRMGDVLVEYVDNVGKKTGAVAKTAVVVGTDDAFGKTCSKAINLGLKKFGIQALADVYYPVKATDLTVEIADLAAKKPDVWFFTSQLNDAVLITRALYQQKVKALGFVTFAAGFVDPQYLKLVGNLGNGFAAISKYDYDLNTEREQVFDQKMRARYNVPSNHNSSMMYVCAHVVKDALERARSTDRDKLRDALEATEITSGPVMMMPGKGVKFDQNHENMYAKDIMSQAVKNEWRTVWPYERKRKFDPVWPRPSWEVIEKM